MEKSRPVLKFSVFIRRNKKLLSPMFDLSSTLIHPKMRLLLSAETSPSISNAVVDYAITAGLIVIEQYGNGFLKKF
jgi:hypothetical protein